MSYYILTPGNVETGGPELCHQFCSYFNEVNDDKKCYVAYTEGHNDSFNIVDVECRPRYEKYNTSHIKSIDDILNDIQGVVIINETQTNTVSLFNKQKKVIWWMSVDHYLIDNTVENVELIKNNADFHIVQSYYAYEYVKKTFDVDDSRIMFVGDYIGDDYGKFILPGEYRKNRGVFNPKKGFEAAKTVIENNQWMEWVPLMNMTEKEMILNMQIAKVYIDFGYHPGKDRIPREAASCGCCVITNREGSAAYYEDVMIDDNYKFSNVIDDVDKISALLHDICENFGEHQASFEKYREKIKTEKNEFIEEIRGFSLIDFYN